MYRCQFPDTSSRHCVAFLVAALLALWTVGCGGSDAPKRYELWGTVTYEGEPVPSGIIVFTNKDTLYDTACSIEDGKFESQDGKGHTGGKFRVSVEAWSRKTEAWEDEAPKLFAGTYSQELELPPEPKELNLEFKKEDFK